MALLGIGAPAALADNAPSIAEEQATDIGVSTVRLTGKVNPNGAPGEPSNTTWEIDYRIEGSEEWLFAGNGFIGEPESEANVPVTVEALIGFGGELKAGEKYQFRIVAENLAGKAKTPLPVGFQMDAPNPPSLTAEATAVGLAKATLKGTVDPEGGNVNAINEEVLPIHWQLQYSEDPGTQGWTTAAETFSTGPAIEGDAAKGTDPIEVEAVLTPANLKGGTTYKFRLHALYANPYFGLNPTEADSSVGEFTTDPVAAPVVSAPQATAITDTGAHLSGTVEVTDPDEAFNASCRFEYLTQKEFEDDGNVFPEPGGAPSIGCTPNPVTGSESQPVTVQADLAGLQPSTTYHLRLVASNAGGQAATPAAGTFATDAILPTIEPEAWVPLAPDEVKVAAFLNPHNSTLSVCRFDYGPTSAYGQSAPCTSLPTGNEETRVHAVLTGLEPSATYHYRLVATSGGGTSEGPDETLQTPEVQSEEACANAGAPGAAMLPECRAWETVSPPEKNVADIMLDAARFHTATDGDAITFPSLSAFGDVNGMGIATEYMAERSGAPATNGWVSHGITPPQQPSLPFQALTSDVLYVDDLSPDLSTGIFKAVSPLTADPKVAAVPNLYRRADLRNPGFGSYSLLTGCPLCYEGAEEALPPVPLTGAPKFTPNFDAASADQQTIAFESVERLTADAPAQPVSLCLTKGVLCKSRLYESDHGEVRFAGMVPPAGENACGGSGESACQAAPASSAAQTLGPEGFAGGHPIRAPKVVSADGSRVFFTVPLFGNEVNGGGNLYVRIDGTETDQLNASERTDCAEDPTCGGDVVPDPAPDTAKAAAYWTASRDGSRVFFTSPEALTDDAPGDNRALYMYDTSKPASDPHNLTLLSDPREDVRGVIDASDSGAFVYYISKRIRALRGRPGELSIELWHDGERTYVGGVSSDDELFIGRVTYSGGVTQARVSPDGRSLLFPGYDSFSLATEDPHVTAKDCLSSFVDPTCRQLYLYSADTHSLACVSCDPSGAAPQHNASDFTRAAVGFAAFSVSLNHPMTPDGRLVFFDTADPLVADDTNGSRDVYEYDRQTASVHLISSGTDPGDAYFIDATPSGHDVFFLTRQRLTGWDADSSYDLYDARVGGGFPEPPATPSPCSGDSCRAAAGPTPSVSVDGSARLKSKGNSVQRRCRKGRHLVRKNGRSRCVKRKKHHQHHGRSGAGGTK